MTKYGLSQKNFSKQEKKKGDKTSKKVRLFNLFSFTIILIFGACYVALVNDLTVKGIKTQELKRYSSYLQEERRNLNVKVASLKSYENIVQRTSNLSMVSADDIKYLNTPGDVLVKR